MARYTGPKTKIARKFGEAIFGEDKSFEKRNYPLQDNMATTADAEKNLNMQSNLWKSKRLNTPMVF